MKAELLNAKNGFSTLEIMIAFAVLILSLTAVIQLVFSGSILLNDSLLSTEAVAKAEDLLESAEASSTQNFYSVQGFGPLIDGNYKKILIVNNMDLYTKELTAKIAWQNDGRQHSLDLTTLLVDKLGALGGDACSQNAVGDWKNPQILNLDFAKVTGLSSNFSISSVDAYRGRLYIGADKTTNKTDPTFFIFDITSSTTPVLISALDNDAKVTAGIAAIKVVGNYAYLASVSSYSRGQLQILDLTLNPPQIIKTFKIPVLNPTGASKGLGSGIFVKSNLVYLGLTKSDSENEFNIIDVLDPLNPSFKGSFNLGNGINSVLVKGSYAYLAHPTSASSSPQEQLTILDVSDSTNPLKTGGFYFNGSSGGNGKSLYFLNDKLFFGRTASKISGSSADFIPEFFVLDNSAQEIVPSNFLGSASLPTPQSLNGLVIRQDKAYFLTNDYFQVWNLSNLSNINPYSVVVNLPASSTSFDCEENSFYISSNDTIGKGYLSIINAGP